VGHSIPLSSNPRRKDSGLFMDRKSAETSFRMVEVGCDVNKGHALYRQCPLDSLISAAKRNKPNNSVFRLSVLYFADI
jgi:hypothetical protein